jgi:hypothetical protein
MKFIRALFALPGGLLVAALSYFFVGFCLGFLSQIMPVDIISKGLIWAAEFFACFFFMTMLWWTAYLIAPKDFGKVTMLITIGYLVVLANYSMGFALQLMDVLPLRAYVGAAIGFVYALSLIAKDSKKTTQPTKAS